MLNKRLVAVIGSVMLSVSAGISSTAFAATTGSTPSQVTRSPQIVSPSPNTRACYTGWEFDVISQPEDNLFTPMVQGLVTLNTNANGNNPEHLSITVTSTFSGSYTKSASSTGTLGGGWGPISASVGYTANQSVTWTQKEALTQSIPYNEKGWISYGELQNQWYGNYYYLNSNCTHATNDITVTSPKQQADEPHWQALS